MGDLTQVAASVLPGTSANINTTTVAPGITIVQGDGIFVNTSTNLAYKATANNGSGFTGIALSAGSPGQPITYDTSDWNAGMASGINLGVTVSSGLTVYMSANSGKFTVSLADISTGQVVVAIGQAYADGTVGLKPNRGGPHY